MILRSSLTILTAFSLCFVSLSHAQADDQEQTWYEVSLAIFKHKNSVTGNEKWRRPDELKLSFPAGIVKLDRKEQADVTGQQVVATDSSEADLPRQEDLIAFQDSSPSDQEFKQALASIELSSNYEVMLKNTWQQPALDKNQAIPVLVQAGNEYDGYFELEGSITLVVSRYLHIKADLWLADYIQQVEMAAPWWQSDNLFNEQQGEYQSIQLGDFSSQETTTRYESVRTVVLNESRRMRSGELHYMDHPLFGIIVKVTPIEVAEEAFEPATSIQ